MGNKIWFLGPSPGLERFAAVVELETADGDVWRAEQDRNVSGRYENPMDEAEVEAKALELMKTVIPAEQAQCAALISRHLETLEDVRPLVQALCRAGAVC
jgi:2-methylcitrate dehydratase PrpD